MRRIRIVARCTWQSYTSRNIARCSDDQRSSVAVICSGNLWQTIGGDSTANAGSRIFALRPGHGCRNAGASRQVYLTGTKDVIVVAPKC